MIIPTTDNRLQFEAIVDLGADHWPWILSWVGSQGAQDDRDSARIEKFGQRASICPEQNLVGGSDLMPLGRIFVLSCPTTETVLGRCYRQLIAICTVQEVRERRQVMPTWTPTTDQKSLNKRVTTIGSNQSETSSIPI